MQLIQGKAGGIVAQVAVRIPVGTRDWFRDYAAKKGQSMNTAFNEILREKMQAEEATAQK